MNATNWLEALKKECDETSQSRAAMKLGYSPSVINQVLKGTYKGDLNGVIGTVKGALMGEIVDCPVIGEMPKDRCVDNQKRSKKFAATNPTRIQLAKACPLCEHNKENTNESK